MDNSIHQVSELASVLYRSLNTPYSLGLLSSLKCGDWKAIAQAKLDPSMYTDAVAYRKDAIAHGFLRKIDGLPTGVDLHAEALKTFYACEKQCASTNSRLAGLLDDYCDQPEGPTIFSIIDAARGFVRKVLGPLPLDLVPKLGKGSTFSDRGKRITIPHKFSSRPTRTSSAWWTESFWIQTAWGKATLADHPCASAPLLTRGNRFDSVPKDSTKNRGICIEPSLNLAFQLGIGRFLKDRIKASGIDLATCQQKHQRLARRASVDGSLATIDLSNASDTICSSLVKLLLPEAWHDLLFDLRSPFTLVEDKWVRLEKFSSMGNGFTFELETLIFLALAAGLAAARGDDGFELIKREELSGYGDDIIIKTELAADFVALLPYFGLTPNVKKTFLSGPFRESCGGDFFLGEAVRPFNLKEIPREPSQWISTANSIRALAVVSNDNHFTLELREPWLLCLDSIPSRVRRLRGPRSLGDLVIHDHPRTWMVKRGISTPFGVDTDQRQIYGLKPMTRPIPLSRFSPNVQLACCVYGVPSIGATPRDEVIGYRICKFALLEDSEF